MAGVWQESRCLIPSQEGSLVPLDRVKENSWCDGWCDAWGVWVDTMFMVTWTEPGQSPGTRGDSP